MGGASCLHNHCSARIWIMRGPLWRRRGRFSSPFIWYISGTERRRLRRHSISNHIACDQSNVVVVLGPYAFASNECKSTPSLLRQWQQLHRGRCSLPPWHFWETFFLLPPFLWCTPLATDSFGVIVQSKPWSCTETGTLANEGQMQAVCLSVRPERVKWGRGGIPALHGEWKHGCLTEKTNQPLGIEEKQTSTSRYDQTLVSKVEKPPTLHNLLWQQQKMLLIRYLSRLKACTFAWLISRTGFWIIFTDICDELQRQCWNHLADIQFSINFSLISKSVRLRDGQTEKCSQFL